VSESLSVQERYAPQNRCFGCGPANAKGLRIRSFERADELVAEWTPEPHHEAWPGAVNGGILGALLDCHSNWAAAIHLMRRSGSETLPSTVTAEFHVKLLRVTPSGVPLMLRAKVVESQGSKATVEAEVVAAGKTTATCRGVFVAVAAGHPAHHRWGMAT
jgi:acyl-coenzyme A thioesterase PaaI-like protein